MKEMIKTENMSYTMIGLGFLGLLAYGYLLIFSNLSTEDMKYSVMVCSIAALLPFAVTIRKMSDDFSSGIFWGVAVGVAALVFFVDYSMMNTTDDSIIFDLYAVISSESFRWLYLILIIIATISPFIWAKGASWILAIVVGVLIPVILSTILFLLAIVLGCYLLSSLFGSKGSSSSGFGSFLSDISSNNKQEGRIATLSKQTTQVNSISNPKSSSNSNSSTDSNSWKTNSWTYGSATFKGSEPSSCMSHGSVNIWYNGSLSQRALEGDVEIWEGTGDICVVFPKNYHGRQMRFFSTGGNVQIQTLR